MNPIDVARELGIDPSLVEKACAIAALRTDDILNRFKTQDPDCILLKHKVKLLSNLDDTVLITGESGTGKELIAQALHGNRHPSKFFAINCAGIPTSLVESELFGHVRGSFTGANADKPGVFRAADGGTVFLDEIGELPLDVQAKLLRVLQEKRVRRVGDYAEFAVSFRCIAATHHNLQKEVSDGKFREDLYYRISTFELYTKPLRDRFPDIELIVKDLLKVQEIPADFKPITYSDIEKGNVRAVQRIVRRYQVFKNLI